MNTLALDGWLREIWLKPGNSNLAPSVDGLFMFILWVCIISFIILMVPMCWWAFKYRRRPGHVQQRTPNHNTFLEVTWVGVPLIIVTIIFFWGFHGYMHGQIASSQAEIINVEGKKWNWTVTYANGAGSGEQVYLDAKRIDENTVSHAYQAVPIIVVPEGRPVKFMMTSSDVIHSFYIPDMRIKMDVFPNRKTSLTFTPTNADPTLDQAGPLYTSAADAQAAATGKGRDHFIFCAEYCGTFHSEMAAILRVLPEDEYNATLTEWANIEGKYGFDGEKDKAGQQLLPMWQLGQWVHKAQGCATCHSVDGSKGSGPSWKGYYGTEVGFAGGGKVAVGLYPGLKDLESTWDNYIRESILEPAKHIHEGYPNQMPTYAGKMSERQINGVIAYMRYLAGKTDNIPTGGPKPAAGSSEAKPEAKN